MPFALDCAVGVISGVTAATCAAPFILTVDRAVTEVSAGKSRMGPALLRGLTQIATRPGQLLLSLPFWMVAGVCAWPLLQPTHCRSDAIDYWWAVIADGSTYATANTIDCACERLLDPDEPSSPVVHNSVKCTSWFRTPRRDQSRSS